MSSQPLTSDEPPRDKLFRLAKENWILRISAGGGLSAEEACQIVSEQGGVLISCGLPRSMEHLLK